MNKIEIMALIKKRIAFHRKHFDRYRDEVDAIQEMKYILKRNLSQKKYYSEMYGRELAIMDELSLVRDAILGDSSQ